MLNYRKDKLLKLHETKDWSDCTFLIADERIPAHKFLLACDSPVFESMFYGELASDEITIEDIDSDVFKKALEFVYTDRLQIVDVLEAWSLVYVSQKYFLLELQRLCVEYIRENLSIRSLLMNYEYARLYNQNGLAERCLEDVCVYARGVLLFSDYHMQANTLHSILKENRGDATDLIMLAISWGIEECAVRDLVLTKKNIQSVFDKTGLTKELRFREFNLYQAKSLLKSTTKEHVYALEIVIDLCQQFCSDLNNPSNNASKSKPTKELQYKFRTEYKNSVCVYIPHYKVVSPVVRTNRDCLIFGVAVTTKSQPFLARTNVFRGGANVLIYEKYDNISHLIFEHANQNCSVKYGDEQKINFPVPVLFEALKRYMICIEYVADYDRGENVLLRYMSDKLSRSKGDKTVIQFLDDGDGCVLKGLCFYEA